MKQELRTMEEKQKLDPNEMMENGMTREQNEKLELQHSSFSLMVGLFLVITSVYLLVQVMFI
jgi:hypothetical protein